jgi:hypothetical protein
MLFMIVFFAFLLVAITEYTLPSFMMTNDENEESLNLLLMNDSDTSMLTNLINQGVSASKEIFSNMDDSDNSSCAAMVAYKGKKASSLNDSNEKSSSRESPAHKKIKSKHFDSASDESSLYEETDNKKTFDENSCTEQRDNKETDDEDELNMNENASHDEDVSEKELDLPVNRNRQEMGQAVEPYHWRRNLHRNMAAVGFYANRDVTNLTNIVATSPRLTAILVENLPKWNPSVPLLVRSADSPRRLGPCCLFSHLFRSVVSFLS